MTGVAQRDAIGLAPPQREATLRQVFSVLRARWVLVTVPALAVLALCWGYAATLPPAHAATAAVSFAPGGSEDPGTSFLRMLPTYEVAVTSPEAIAYAEQQVGLPSGGLEDAVSTDLPDNSLELTVTVTTPDAATSAAAADALVDYVIEVASGDPLVLVRLAAEAQSAGDESPMRRILVVAAGLVLAPLPGAATALVLEGNRPRLRLPEDVIALGLPVLQIFPLPRGAGWAAASEVETVRFMRLWHIGSSAVHSDVGGIPQEVVVTSIDGHHDDADRVAKALSRVSENAWPERPGITTRAMPWIPAMSVSPAAPATPSAGDLCVLTLRRGLPKDELDAATVLIRRHGGDVLGVVLFR